MVAYLGAIATVRESLVILTRAAFWHCTGRSR